METDKNQLDPILFAVLKSRLDGIVSEMTEVVLRTSRNPILYAAKDFTCSILTHDARLLVMANSLPIHLFGIGSALPPVVNFFGDNIHPGDCFANSSPYHGNTHVGDLTMYVPVFHKDELICWMGTMCHLLDVGAHIPATIDVTAKDVYEEGLHIPPLRIAKNYQEIPDIISLIKANFRYPEQWHGDFLAQIGSLWLGEKRIIELCHKYGHDVIIRFENELIDYGDRRMTEEIKKLPKGTWSIKAQSEKVEPMAPEGVELKLKMSIDPEQATITYDLTEMPDQLLWGYNLSEACSTGACLEGTMPCLDPTLPRNAGVYGHVNIILREGAIVGKPRWPVGTSAATVAIADEVCNMVLNLWEQVELGRGHAGNGEFDATKAAISGTDFRRNHAAYGEACHVVMGGGGASKGCDGWPNFLANCVMGNMHLESIELHELKVPDILWEVGVTKDSGGAGKWRGAVSTYQRIQPRHHNMTGISYGCGHTSIPKGISGGKDGAVANHWIQKHATQEKTRQLKNADVFQVAKDEDWVSFSCGGGGYGNPLKRDPEAVRDDVRNYFVSNEVARNEYGVVLNINSELYEVDYGATKALRAQLKKKRRLQ